MTRTVIVSAAPTDSLPGAKGQETNMSTSEPAPPWDAVASDASAFPPVDDVVTDHEPTCAHHWHGPFDDLDESLTCCDCGARRIVPTAHPYSCRCDNCQHDAMTEQESQR